MGGCCGPKKVRRRRREGEYIHTFFMRGQSGRGRHYPTESNREERLLLAKSEKKEEKVNVSEVNRRGGGLNSLSRDFLFLG